MTTMRHLPQAKGLPSTTIGPGLAILPGLRGRLGAMQERARQRRTLMHLLRCDDHILRDVGLGRHEVMRALVEIERG